MKKTCLLFVLGLCGASLLYLFLIRFFIPELPWGLSIGLCLLGGFSALALFGAVSTIVQGVSDKKVLSSARKGLSFQDGKRAAAIGTIEPSGLKTLTAPFSKRECLAYEYEVYEMVVERTGKTSRSVKKLYCSGFGMVPSQIRTMQGNIRVLGFPLIDEFPLNFTESTEERSRATEYMQQTKFENLKEKLGRIFSEFDDLFLDADGAVRKDLGEPVVLEERHHLTEIIVPYRAEVCAIGVYSAPKFALVANTAALPIRLIPGNPKGVEARLRKKGAGQITLSTIFFLIINAALGFFYYSVEKERYDLTEPEQISALTTAAENRDLKKLELLLQNGVNPNVTDSNSRTLLLTTRDPEVVRLLLRYGANPNVQDPESLETPLFEAARTDDEPLLRALIEGGADVNAISTIPWSHTPIDEALRTGRSNAEDVLIQSGAIDPRVTASNGVAIKHGGEELAVCGNYLRAIQNEDKARLRSLTTQRYEYFFDDVDFNIWKNAYPIALQEFQGYSNARAATIQFRGERIDGGETEWIFQLQKQPDGWKLHQTWPLTGESYNVIWR